MQSTASNIIRSAAREPKRAPDEVLRPPKAECRHARLSEANAVGVESHCSSSFLRYIGDPGVYIPSFKFISLSSFYTIILTSQLRSSACRKNVTSRSEFYRERNRRRALLVRSMSHRSGVRR
jgi:hypothetical protein